MKRRKKKCDQNAVFFQSDWPSGRKPSEEAKKPRPGFPCKKWDGMNTLEDA